MQISKDSLLKFRLNEDSAKKFIAICEAEETSASAVLRRFVADYVIQHSSTKLGLSVEVTLGAPYGHGYYEQSEYAISAKLMGDESLLEDREIPFLLPDFTRDGKELFRVDSFAHHRIYFPNCRNANGRLLGAKLIKNEWQGAIFLYEPHTFGNPKSHFEEIKTALERNIFNAATQYIQSLNQPEQPDENQA